MDNSGPANEQKVRDKEDSQLVQLEVAARLGSNHHQGQVGGGGGRETLESGSHQRSQKVEADCKQDARQERHLSPLQNSQT